MTARVREAVFLEYSYAGSVTRLVYGGMVLTSYCEGTVQAAHGTAAEEPDGTKVVPAVDDGH